MRSRIEAGIIGSFPLLEAVAVWKYLLSAWTLAASVATTEMTSVDTEGPLTNDHCSIDPALGAASSPSGSRVRHHRNSCAS
jgi:hypothetical protein